MMIFALVAALVSTIIISSASMTSRTLSKEHTRLIASAELDFIAGRLWMADSINLSTVPPGSTWDIDAVPFGSEALYIGTTVAPAGTSAEPYHVGYLWYKRARDTSSRNIFGISFYRDLTSRLRIEVLNNSRRGTRPASGSLLALGGPTVTISIELLNTDGTVVETYSKSLELLNSEPISQNTGNAIGALVVPGTVLPPEGNALVVELTHQKPPTS
jgi:hypothetical protein